MNDASIFTWLLEGDPAVRYQTQQGLLGEKRLDLQARIATEGRGAHMTDGGFNCRFHRRAECRGCVKTRWHAMLSR